MAHVVRVQGSEESEEHEGPKCPVLEVRAGAKEDDQDVPLGEIEPGEG